MMAQLLSALPLMGQPAYQIPGSRYAHQYTPQITMNEPPTLRYSAPAIKDQLVHAPKSVFSRADKEENFGSSLQPVVNAVEEVADFVGDIGLDTPAAKLRDRLLKPRTFIQPDNAYQFLTETHLPAVFLDQIMQYFKLLNVARSEKAEEHGIYARETGYRITQLIETDKTLLRAGIAYKKSPKTGKFDVAVLIPGTRHARHWMLNLNLGLVDPNLEEMLSSVSGSDDSSDSDVELDDGQLLDLGVKWRDGLRAILPDFGESNKHRPRVARGFYHAFASLKTQVMPHLEATIRKLKPENIESVSVFGHSLGGVIADMMAFPIHGLLDQLDISQQVSVRLIRVGAPKPGNHAFASLLANLYGWSDAKQIKSSRHISLSIVHPDDAVPLGSLGGMVLQSAQRYAPSPGYLLVVPVHDHNLDPYHHRVRSYEQSIHHFFLPFLSSTGRRWLSKAGGRTWTQ